MEKREHGQRVEYGRLLGMPELMRYTSLGRNRAADLGKSAGAVVRVGKRVLYDRVKVDKWIDEQAQKR